MIFTKQKGASLVTMQRLCELYDQPQNSFPTVHVAGTNGKGSVCTKIASTLQKAGYRTGLYTSPHISSFRERIQIDGEMIPENELFSLLSEITGSPNFFEIATLTAFLYFRLKKVDIAVIETGLGGRWDATNVITPLVSIITSIGLDHVDLIGPTIFDIANEKAGIIKKNIPIVIGPDVPYSWMREKADELHSPLYRSAFQAEDFDLENGEIARIALHLLKVHLPIPEESIHEGIKAKPPCRFEHHTFEKEVVIDVAHNAHGFAKLLQILAHNYPNHDYRFVVGFSKGKDISECARLIQEKAHAVHLVSGSHPRLSEVSDFQSHFGNPLLEKTIEEGVQNALRASHSKQEVVVIAGSFFIMKEARKTLGLSITDEPCDWYDPSKTRFFHLF